MVEVIGDIVAPSDLIIPVSVNDKFATISGAMFISGATLYFSDQNGTRRIVTSS